MFIDQLEAIMLLFYSVFRVVFYKKKKESISCGGYII